VSVEKPNILLIITDHQAWYNHYLRDEVNYSLPVWEQFTKQAMNFERAYCVAPICTPARSSMLTGEYPSKHGQVRNFKGVELNNLSDFRSGQKLYSHYLSEAGYRNAYIGKWHCGVEKIPIDFGIEGWSVSGYGQPYLTDRYQEYIRDRDLTPPEGVIEHWLHRSENTGHQSIVNYLDASGVMDGPKEGHHDHFVSNLAIEKLEELHQADQPWSLVASYWGPHHAYFPTAPFADTVDPESIPEHPTFNDDLTTRPFRHFSHLNSNNSGRADWPDWSSWQKILARAYEQQKQTDDAVGELLHALEQSGQADNTLVIWVCDHGDTVASHGGVWGKYATYTEEVARIPFAVRWPNGFSGGEARSEIVSNMDVTATMLEAAGVHIPEQMSSRSVLPLCNHSDDNWPEATICEHEGHGLNLIQRIMITERYKYVSVIHDGDELYDLQNDPNEINNLLNSIEHQEIAANMRKYIVKHIDKTKDVRADQLKLWLNSQSS
jgi:arylsulfatase A-like enzyme